MRSCSVEEHRARWCKSNGSFPGVSSRPALPPDAARFTSSMSHLHFFLPSLPLPSSTPLTVERRKQKRDHMALQLRMPPGSLSSQWFIPGLVLQRLPPVASCPLPAQWSSPQGNLPVHTQPTPGPTLPAARVFSGH